MSWVTVIWSMAASASLTLGVIQLLVWYKRRSAWANLLLSLTAVATACLSAGEFWMMRAETPAEFGLALRWLHVPGWVCIVSLVGFVRLYLRAGRVWLAWAVCGVRALSLFLNFCFTPNLNYREITSLSHIRFLGESISVAHGVPNPWMLVGQTSMLLLVAFVADATITVWRRGDRRQAMSLGGAILFFTLAAMLQMVLVLWGVILTPLTFSLFFLGIIGAMSYEMSRDALRAAQLSNDLRESEQRFRQVAEAAAEFIWEVNAEGLYTYASPSVEKTLGYTKEELVGKKHYYDLFDLSAGEELKAAARRVIAAAKPFRSFPNPVVSKSGKIVHLETSGSPVLDPAGNLVGYRGADTDVTERRRAEAAARELGGRLINAQEDERRRIARDLHDDLSQRLALVSVQMETFGQKPPAQPEAIAGRMQEFSGAVKSISSEVHRLAHELHPAKLDQLGLTAAVRGFCKELSAAHEIAIEFEARDVPRALPDDVALCLYRITQEALQNVVKHSGATGAKVELAVNDHELHLLVSDDGHGFDPQATETGSSLGIISMRERVRMVHGQMSVDSRPGEGTRIEVRVPIAAGNS